MHEQKLPLLLRMYDAHAAKRGKLYSTLLFIRRLVLVAEERKLERRIRFRQFIFGDEALAIALPLCCLGMVRTQVGNYKEALELLQESRIIATHHLGSSSIFVAFVSEEIQSCVLDWKLDRDE